MGVRKQKLNLNLFEIDLRFMFLFPAEMGADIRNLLKIQVIRLGKIKLAFPRHVVMASPIILKYFTQLWGLTR